MNSKKLIVPGKIITVDASDRVLTNTAVEITDDKITGIFKPGEIDINKFDCEVFNYPGLVLIPGFIQTHVHLCQTLFRGLADDLPLLEWLKKKIFPFENAHDKNSLRIAAKLGLNELISGGTTTLLDMGTLRNQEVVFEEMISSGIRGFSGKCLIDENGIYPDFKESTEDELKYERELAEEFHNSAEGRIKYGFAPRFVLSCSEELMKETKAMMKDFPGSVFHTHSSENKDEVAEVRRRFNKENIEYFNSIEVLDDQTVLAHCIHLNNGEKQILKKNNVRIAHCPSANLKLASGIANIPEYLKLGISVSIGADGAPCNNNLSIFTEMRFAGLIQKPSHGADAINAKTIFRLATIDGAKALHLDDETGSVEVGKKADLVLLNLNSPTHSLSDDNNDIYSNIVYASNSSDVKSVMINGKFVVKDGGSLIFDENDLVSEGKSELKKLLNRIDKK